MNRLYFSELLQTIALTFCCCWPVFAQDTSEPAAPVIAAASDEGQQAIAGFKRPRGWTAELAAAEPDVAARRNRIELSA